MLKGLGLHGIQAEAIQGSLTGNGLRRCVIEFRKGKTTDA